MQLKLKKNPGVVELKRVKSISVSEVSIVLGRKKIMSSVVDVSMGELGWTTQLPCSGAGIILPRSAAIASQIQLELYMIINISWLLLNLLP